MSRAHNITVYLLMVTAHVAAAPIEQRGLPSWLNNVFYPDPGNRDPSAQIQCYALPYGGLGITSHFLTYLTAILLIIGQEPLRPWKELKQAKWARIWNTMLGVVSLVVTVCIAGFTMKSCSGEWPFVLLAFWKLTLSFSMGMLSIIGPWHHDYHKKQLKSLLSRDDPSAPRNDRSTVKELPWTVLPYLFGTLVGIVGLFDLIHLNFSFNRAVWILTITLIACVSFAMLMAMTVAICTREDFSDAVSICIRATLVFICIFVVVVVFFSDLVLAALNNNWSGQPSGDYAILFWLYFACKRLPMLSL